MSTNGLVKKLFLLTASVLVMLSPNPGEAEESVAVQTANRFLSEVLNVEATVTKEKPGISYEKIGLPTRTLCIDDKCRDEVDVSEDGSSIYGYRARTARRAEDFVQGKTLDDLIDEDEAFAIVLPILNYFDLSSDKKDYYILFSRGVRSGPEDLSGANWIIRKYLEFNGIPCRLRQIFIIISAATGNITRISFSPIILPENKMNIEISYADARTAALNWLKDNYYGSIAGDEESGTIVIAPNVNEFDRDREQTEAIQTYYCWEVPFHAIGGAMSQPQEIEHSIWVNVETGDVVGASLFPGTPVGPPRPHPHRGVI